MNASKTSSPSAPEFGDLADSMRVLESAARLAAGAISATPFGKAPYRAAHDALVRELSVLSLPIASKLDPASQAIVGTAQDYLLIDPLDGATSYKRCAHDRATRGGLTQPVLDTPEHQGQLGHGPLIGLQRKGKLQAAVFYHFPQQALFFAARNCGTWKKRAPFSASGNEPLVRLLPTFPSSIQKSVALFFPGAQGELGLIEHLRNSDLIENAYRFGGFASDCARLASGFEQILIQFCVRAWDFPAVLFAVEAGYEVRVAPSLRSDAPPARRADDWLVQAENPIVAAPSTFMTDLLAQLLKSGPVT